MDTFSPHNWVENFHMKKETFVYLCNKVRPIIFRQNTRFRQAISVERRVAIMLWCIATPCEYRSLAHLFGLLDELYAPLFMIRVMLFYMH